MLDNGWMSAIDAFAAGLVREELGIMEARAEVASVDLFRPVHRSEATSKLLNLKWV